MNKEKSDQHTITWKGLLFPSLENSRLIFNEGLYLLEGSFTARFRETALSVVYQVRLDESFNLLDANLEVVSPWNRNKLVLKITDGSWYVNGQKRDDLEKCTDIDVELSPSTNTLPIRRCSLKVGDKVDITVAWIRIPNLQIVPVDQSYQKVSETQYIYRSNNFQARLEVHGDGLVKSYEGVWEEYSYKLKTEERL